MEVVTIFAQQSGIMVWKHFQQKRLAGRATLKDFMIPVAMILFWDFIFVQLNQSTVYHSAVYNVRSLPPLSGQGEWGIFQKDGDDDSAFIQEFIGSRKLFYSPNDNTGVNELMGNFSDMFPGVNVRGEKNMEEVNLQYQSNLFTTWAALEFELSDEQISADSLITSQADQSAVSYKIRISPLEMVLPSYPLDGDVYKDSISSADSWQNSGYLTIQNFVSSYLAKQYDGVDPNFEVEMRVQRYPYDERYEDSPSTSLSFNRFFLWKWMASVLLSAAIILPILGVAAQTVKEKENKMQDLLQISGLLDLAYWVSYEVAAMALSATVVILTCLLLTAGTVLTVYHLGPYILLLFFFSMALFASLMAFGFVVFRSEYFGLPAFLLTVALAVAGDYLANDYAITIGAKLFLGFLFPPLNLSLGIFAIETYIYHNNDYVDYDHVDHTKSLASLSSVIGCLFASTVLYLFVCWGMPFDWILARGDVAFHEKDPAMVYPCDDMDDELDDMVTSEERPFEDAPVLLDVKGVHHVYPDGTEAVKGISFRVREGEVLSYLGANGAGKSTTMEMLCGTLDITLGDASVGGNSITRHRTRARRNLGICMQQNVIWDDISIVDHLYVFGRLRGLTGAVLEKDVQGMMDSLGFPEKAHSAAGTLSGGQKRRLCVGISMVGGNPVVYLDEPTAGLDPVSRRQLWDLVQRNRTGRAILLTTHFLDEADVLGDRIAIVKEGRLRAIGTSKFLKARFGMGYLMRASLTAEAKPEDVLQAVAGFVPEAEVVSAAGTEFSIRLPKDAVVSFPRMFERVDECAEELGIVNYGIETTTLEEVFIRIVNEDTELLIVNHKEANKILGASKAERDLHQEGLKRKDEKRHPLSEETVKLLLTPGRSIGTTEIETLNTQVRVLLWKRFFQFARSKGQWMMGVVVPTALMVIAGIIMYNIATGILRADPGVTAISYDSGFATPVAGSSEGVTAGYIARAGVSDSFYVGDSFSDLRDYIENSTDTTGGSGASSAAAVFYDSLFNMTIMYNSTYPLSYAGLVGDVLQAAVSNATGNRLIVNTECNPLPDEALDDQTNLAIVFFFVACLIAGSLGSGLSIVISGERVGLLKHQQLASGVSLLSYWLSNFLFDYAVASLHTLGLTFALYCARAYVYSGDDFGLIFGIGLLFNITIIYRFYVFSNFVYDIRMAQTFYFYGSLLSMFVLILTYATLVYTVLGGNGSSSTAQYVAIACTVVDPSFGYLFLLAVQNDFLGIRTQNNSATVASSSVNGGIIWTLFLSAIFYLICLIYIEHGFFVPASWKQKTDAQKRSESFNAVSAEEDPHLIPDEFEIEMRVETGVTSGNNDEHLGSRMVPVLPLTRVFGTTDPDVEQEKIRVNDVYRAGEINTTNHAIFVHKLSKVFYGRGTQPTKVAVKELSLSIEKGEIFGLLGANGAGKTTMLKIVSGLDEPTSGRAYVNGFNIVEDKQAAQRSMGLCPQFDTLVERLTVRENILLFAQVKGIEKNLVVPVCEAFMTALNIAQYENKLIMQLSGGNRRKVSLAVALLGSPPTIYLDEPSTGLDPVASRLMWRLLSKIGASKHCAIILTTHNMLECEAVCTRVGVMKIGELVCLGDSMHLRSAHGTGFLLEMAVQSKDTLPDCKEFVRNQFTGGEVIDEQGCMVNFEIPTSSVGKLSSAFDVLQREKERLGVVDYALSQSTLEQVFLKQIRPNERDEELLAEQRKTEQRVPQASDYIMAYTIFFLALIIPGLHHFYLGNFWRGVKYLFTLNELYVGWFLDLFELHVLLKKSVEQYGSQKCFQPCKRNCTAAV